jgi:hypothetical protein
MENKKLLHVSMMNSYNVIAGKASINDIAIAGLGFFIHQPDEPVSPAIMDYIISYFEEKEMFEYCADIKKVKDAIYNDDGTFREDNCKCEMPMITNYACVTRCDNCNNPVRL